MKQGNSESDQKPNFVCFRKVVYMQGQNPKFRMPSNFFSRKNSDFREKIRILEEKNLISGKKSDSLKKIRDFVFPGMFHNKTIF